MTVAKRLKSGLLQWRYLSPKQQRAEIRKYGSKESAQRARRTLPANKLSERTRRRLASQYGNLREATRQRRREAARRYTERRRIIDVSPPPPPEEPEEPELDEDALAQAKYDRAWEVYNGASRISIEEWRARLRASLGRYMDLVDDRSLFYHDTVRQFVDMYGPPMKMVG